MRPVLRHAETMSTSWIIRIPVPVLLDNSECPFPCPFHVLDNSNLPRYNRGNDFYGWFLCDKMLYSVGLWDSSDEKQFEDKDTLAKAINIVRILPSLRKRLTKEHLIPCPQFETKVEGRVAGISVSGRG